MKAQSKKAKTELSERVLDAQVAQEVTQSELERMINVYLLIELNSPTLQFCATKPVINNHS
jgi:hypothetical protein